MILADGLFTLRGGTRHDLEIDAWLSGDSIELHGIARRWFNTFRQCGEDVVELMHDGCPTVCVGEAALGYVGVFRSHVNVGFFRGAFLPDPDGLLEGTGKRMRHVKIIPGENVDPEALVQLIHAAYQDIKNRTG